jgi:hypothetical protein
MGEVQAGKIMVLQRVRGDWPIGHHLVAEPGIYVPFLNQYGAVSVEVNGELLGLKPAEFKWVDKPAPEVYERQDKADI